MIFFGGGWNSGTPLGGAESGGLRPQRRRAQFWAWCSDPCWRAPFTLGAGLPQGPPAIGHPPLPALLSPSSGHPPPAPSSRTHTAGALLRNSGSWRGPRLPMSLSAPSRLTGRARPLAPRPSSSSSPGDLASDLASPSPRGAGIYPACLWAPAALLGRVARSPCQERPRRSLGDLFAEAGRRRWRREKPSAAARYLLGFGRSV